MKEMNEGFDTRKPEEGVGEDEHLGRVLTNKGNAICKGLWVENSRKEVSVAGV